MAGLDERAHEPEQQRQQQRPDVLAVDVGVGHQHDLAVAQLVDVEVVVDAGAERGDQRLHLVVLQHPVDARLLDVEDLAADREDRLRRGSRADFAEPPAESPSTMKTSHSSGLVEEQSASLPGRPPPPSRPLRLRARSRALRAAIRAVAAARDLRAISLPSVGFCSNHAPSWSLTIFCTNVLGLGVAELGLGLALELRLAELDGHDRGEALADVLAGEVGVLVLEDVPLAGEPVDERRQRRAEALLVGAALVGVDRVGEGVDRLGEAGVPLHRHLDRDPPIGVLRFELDQG